MKPEVCVLKTDGINCDEETRYAFETAGGQAEIVHVNQLKSREKVLGDYDILALSGGFSYGDDIASGKVLSVELQANREVAKQIEDFVYDKEGLALGVCNGFQVLVRSGLLPRATLGRVEATLTDNDINRFQCGWVRLKVEDSRCEFALGLPEEIRLPIAHGEGKFVAPDETLRVLEQDRQVVFRYADDEGPAKGFPDNPNGSMNAIAGICDDSGRILGLMPHPERYVETTHPPDWRSRQNGPPQGLMVFERMVDYAKER